MLSQFQIKKKHAMRGSIMGPLDPKISKSYNSFEDFKIKTLIINVVQK